MREKVWEFWRGNWEPLSMALLLTVMAWGFNLRNHLSASDPILWLCTLGGALLILAPTVLLPRRPRLMVLIGVAILAALVLLANQLYYRYYRDFITTTTVMLAGQVYGVRSSILPLAKSMDLLYVSPAFVFAWLASRRRVEYPSRFAGRVRASLAIALAGSGLFGAGYGVALHQQQADHVHWDGNYPLVSKLGLFTFHLYDAQRFASRQLGKAELDDEAVQRLKSYFDERGARPNAFTGVGAGKNLLVIQLESFENFPIGLTIEGQELTPNLNRLSKDALYFSNIFYQTAKGNTSDAEFMLNNSLLPLQTASVNWQYPENDYLSLPLLLKQHGYATLAFHAYDKIFWNREFMYPRFGFDQYFSQADFQRDEVVNLGLSDESFYRQSLDILDRFSEPFYAQMVSLTSHHPFVMPEAYRKLVLPASLPQYVQDYFHSIHYADKAIGSLLRALKDRGLDERTVLVIYGDHEGVSFKHYREIWQLLGHAEPKGWHLAEASLQTVPLFIRVPGSPLQGTVDQVGGQIDILPTLSNLMGIGGKGIYLGQDLLEAKPGLTPLTGRYPLGSFVDRESIFVASPDGQLEQGKFFDRVTGEPLNPALAARKYEAVVGMYQLSKTVIEQNLVLRLGEPGQLTEELSSDGG